MGPHDDSSMTRAWRWLARAGEVLSPCHASFLVPLRGDEEGRGLCASLEPLPRTTRVFEAPSMVSMFPDPARQSPIPHYPTACRIGTSLVGFRTHLCGDDQFNAKPGEGGLPIESVSHPPRRTDGRRGHAGDTLSARLFCFKFGAPGRRLLAAADSMESEI